MTNKLSIGRENSAPKYTLEDVILSHVNRAQRQLYTVIPAIILSYDNNTQTAEITLAISEMIRGDKIAPAPRIKKVPVMMPYGKNFSMSWELEPGDNVLALFSMRDMTSFNSSSGSNITNANSIRNHDISDVIVLPGLSSRQTQTINQTYKGYSNITDEQTHLVFNDGDSNGLLIKSDKKIKVETTSDLEATVGGTLTANVTGDTTITTPTLILNGNMQVNGTINTTGDIVSDTDVEADGVSLKTHTHTGNQGSPTSPPL